jgi:tetratricopeptide (TPR) repeat protein
MSRSAPPLTGYTTREVAHLLGLSEGRVRSWVRAGFLHPRRGRRGEYRFSFQDLVLLKAAQGLMAARIPAQRVRNALARLAEQLPRGRSLAGVRIAAEGGEVVVRAEGQAWNPESGQRVFDFGVGELAARAAPLTHQAVAAVRERADTLGADDWYELGYELEATSPREAEEAYGRALALEPDHADAHLNLGRLLHEEGRPATAEAHYRRAAELRPGDATAAFNLGVAMQDLRRYREAVAAYRRAVTADPACADAYYNLAAVYETLGEPALALQNLRAYKVLVQGRRQGPRL